MRRPRRARHERGAAGQREHRVQVDRTGHELAEPGHCTRLPPRPRSATGTRPRCRDGVATASSRRSTPSTGTPTLGEGDPQDLLVPVGADPVEDDPAQPHPRVVAAEPVRRARPPSGPARRRPRRAAPGAPSSRATCAVEPVERRAAPVEQAHDALDHRDVRAGGAVQEQRHDQLLADQHRVEVAPGPAGGQRVVAGVDVVRADLVRRTPHGPRPRSAAISPVATVVLPCPEAGAATTNGRRGRAHHSMPLWPFWPGVHRVLDLGHLDDQVGGVDQPRVGVPAGDDHVLVARTPPQDVDDVVDVDPAPLHRVGELVEHVEAVASRRPGRA